MNKGTFALLFAPGSLRSPVEQSTKFELLIKLKTVRQIGPDDSTEPAGEGG
jgi:hypothetical protein